MSEDLKEKEHKKCGRFINMPRKIFYLAKNSSIRRM
jgi:hypothetical protein